MKKHTDSPAFRDLKNLSRAILVLERQVRTLIRDLEAFGFVAEVGWINDKQGDLGLRVQLYINGFYPSDWYSQWKPPVGSPIVWDYFRQKYRLRTFGGTRWTDGDCVAEQITALEIWFEQHHKVNLNLMVGGSIILSTPKI